MAHLDEVIVKVDDTLAEGVITHMNELLIALSDDPQLSREERYTQQQRLRLPSPTMGDSIRKSRTHAASS